MKPILSQKITDKLRGRGISVSDLVECFANRTAGFLVDDREEHKTNPDTLWFVAETEKGRILKIMFVPAGTMATDIKSAYDSSAEIQRIYNKYA